MGKKNKSQAGAGLGRSIIKDRFGKKTRRDTEYSSLHTTELQDGYDWGRLNLQSITEQSNLDEFLATAALAGTEFNAEKLNVKFIDPEKGTDLLTEEVKKDVRKAQEDHKACLKIPRRPVWDEFTTPEVLDRLEKDNFLEWRRELALLQEKEHLLMTPFEKNLEFWRQLWRVIERSDIVMQIVDARNPLLFRCEDLEVYVKEVNPNKVNIILVNKADLLSQNQREMWADYFSNVGVKVLFWSAMLETEKLKEKDEEDEGQSDDMEESDDDDDEEESDDDHSIERSGDDSTDLTEQDDALEKRNDAAELKGQYEVMEEDVPEGEKCVEEERLPVNCDEIKTDLGVRDSGSEAQNMDTEAGEGNTRAECCCGDTDNERSKESNMKTDTTVLGGESKRVENTGDLLSGTELLETLKTLHQGDKYTPGQTTVGMVGYPNVGKSSTINAILQMKKVPVSATPGRTKHFQTLFVEPTLMLCDCPGLVMPSFVSTKADMVVSGILPIDQMRDYLPPVTLVCHQIPRKYLEQVYGIIIRKPREGEDPNRPPTAHELLTSYGLMRGFMTHKGIPDLSRSSRFILKDYVTGKLLYCHPPPGVDTEKFDTVPPPAEKPVPFKHKGKALKKLCEPMNEPVVYHSEIDRAFFAKQDHKIRSKGVHGVEGYQRKEGLATHVTMGDGSSSVQSSTSTLNDKPWKRHNNKHKKEKLRRKHVNLDIHDIM